MSKNTDTILILAAVAGGGYILYKLSKGFEGIGSGVGTAVDSTGKAIGSVTTGAGETINKALDVPNTLLDTLNQGLNKFQQFANNGFNTQAQLNAMAEETLRDYKDSFALYVGTVLDEAKNNGTVNSQGKYYANLDPIIKYNQIPTDYLYNAAVSKQQTQSKLNGFNNLVNTLLPIPSFISGVISSGITKVKDVVTNSQSSSKLNNLQSSSKLYSSIYDKQQSTSSSSTAKSKSSDIAKDSLSGKDKGKGTYTVTDSKGNKTVRYFQ
jgi:phage-related protein